MTGTAIELVSPAGPGSAVEGRLTEQGPGLYHLAFVVDDLDHEAHRLRAAGLLALDAEPCRGARPGMRVVFMYLPEPAELLVELVCYDRVDHPAPRVDLPGARPPGDGAGRCP